MLKRTIIVVAVFLGCGKDAATSRSADHHAPVPATAAGKKPCQYMTRADAEAAIGLPLPKTMENEALGECDYTTAEFYGAALTVGDWDGVKVAATSGGPNHQPKVVTGVGDEALNLGGNLYVRKGDRGFLLSLNGPAVDGLEDKGLARATILALTILPNL